MERYQPKGNLAAHRVIGNLYIADSIKDATNSRDFILKDRREAIEKFSNRAKAMISLAESWQGAHAFIFISHAMHRPARDRLRDENYIRIFDEYGNTGLVKVSPERFSEEKYRVIKQEIWQSDIVLFASFMASSKDQDFRMAYFFDELRKHPKQYLSDWILAEKD